MNKQEKAIYAKYGIETSGNKLVSPIGLISPVLKSGNTKTGKSVWTFSTLAGKKVYHTKYGLVYGTCTCNCIGCYAMAGFYTFQRNIDILAGITILSRDYTEWLERAIKAQLEIIGSGMVRISASGDVENCMIETWQRIAREFTSFRFWTYTKNPDFENAFDDIENANIVKSIIPKIGINFGHCDYILSVYKNLQAENKNPYICKCEFDKTMHCENCKGCSTHKCVLFLEHSTRYKGQEDKLYNELKELVMKQ